MRNTSRFPALVVLGSTLLIAAAVFLSGGKHGQLTPQLSAASQANDPRLAKAWKFQRDLWTYVHLEGTPAEIGFQHGSLLSAEIADAFNALKLVDTHRTKRDWNFFRETAQNVLWPHIDPQYQQQNDF